MEGTGGRSRTGAAGTAVRGAAGNRAGPRCPRGDAGWGRRPRGAPAREPVKLSGFGAFSVRDKGARMGRNPRTGEAAAIPPRRVVTFRASRVLKRRIGQAQAVKRAMGEASETISTSSGPSFANTRQATTSASESNVP